MQMPHSFRAEKATPYGDANVRHADEAADADMAVVAPGHVLLRQARTKRGLSLQQVADACGINIRQYQKFESGERGIAGCAFATALRLCRVLDLDPWLFLSAAASAPTPTSCAPASAEASSVETADAPQRVRRLP